MSLTHPETVYIDFPKFIIVLIPTRNVLKRTLMLYIAGTRGGSVRLKILMLIDKKPRNINEISEELGLDYKTVQHHIRVLQKSGLVSSLKRKYDNEYSLSELLKVHKDVLKDISDNMGKSK